jgi:hypothetical protein
MPRTSGLCFVIATATRARFVRPGPDNRLHTIRTMGTAQGGCRSNQVPFVGGLADRINDDFASDLFVNLVLLAPTPVLHDLLARVVVPPGSSLEGRDADLMNVPDDQLGPSMQPWLLDAAPGVDEADRRGFW